MLDGLLLRLVWWLVRAVRLVLVVLRLPFAWIPATLAAIAAGLWLLELAQLWVLEAVRAQWPYLPAAERLPWPLLDTTTVLGVFALGVVVATVAGGRRRLVVAAFSKVGDDQAAFAEMLGGLVAAHLAELRDLFVQFDENRLRGERELLVETPAPALQDAISSQATLGLGPFQVPVGFVVGLLGRLVRGPRVTGQVGKDGGQRVITLELHGVDRSRSWVVTASTTEDGAQLVAQEIACRLFAATALPVEVSWRALQSFVAGLRAFRRGQHAPTEKRRLMREAERHLLAAVTTDDRLDFGWHNLGVVYSELGQLSAAQQAFARSNALGGGRWGLLYPMAWNHWQQAHREREAGNLRVAVGLQRQAADLVAQAARVADRSWQRALNTNLAGLLHLDRARLTQEPPALVDAANAFRRAVRLGWWAMCRAELAAPGVPGAERHREQTREFASACQRNIAFVYFIVLGAAGVSPFVQRYVRLRARRALQLARALTPALVDIHSSLGALAEQAGCWRAAVGHLRDAAEFAPEDPKPRCRLAHAEAHWDRVDVALRSCERCVERIGELDAAARTNLVSALSVVERRVDELETAIAPRPAVSGFVARLRLIGRHLALVWRVAGRRWFLFGPTAKVMAVWIAQPASATPLFTGWRTLVAAIRARLAAWPEVEKQLGELRSKGEVAVGGLDAFVAAQDAAGRAWEAAVAQEMAARHALDVGRFADAERGIRGAIERFGRLHEDQVRSRGLQALLAHALRRQGKLVEALAAAQAAVAQDPLSAYEYRQIGLVQQALGQVEAAEASFGNAVRFAPDDPILHQLLGRCALDRRREPGDRANRRRDLEGAVTHLQTALELATDVASRHETQFQLARVLSTAGRNVEAITQLQELERSGFSPAAVGLQFADCLLSTHSWLDAEARFRDLAARLEPGDAAAANALADTDSVDGMTRSVGAAYAHLGVAWCLASRGVAFDEALQGVDRASKALADLADPVLRSSWLGRCASFRGRILALQGDARGARQALLQAAKDDPQPDVFVHLAQVTARLAAELAVGAPREAEFARAREHLAAARRLDFDSTIDAELTAAQQLLDSLEPKVPAAAGAGASLPQMP